MLAALVIIWILLLLLLVLTLPYRLRFSLATTLRRGDMILRLQRFGLTILTLKYELTLFSEPYFRIISTRSGKSYPLLKKSELAITDLESVARLESTELWLTVGIKGDAALCVWALGAAYLFAGIALSSLCDNAVINPAPDFDNNALKIQAHGIVYVHTGQIIAKAIRGAFRKEKR